MGRREPLIISISTAPIKRSEGVFESTLTKARRIISDEEKDPAFYGWLYDPPAGLDPEDPANWHWSNPSLGYMLSLERLKAGFASVQGDPAALRDFKSQNLNIAPETSAGRADERILAWSHQWISRRGYEKRRSVVHYDDFIAADELRLFDGGKVTWLVL